MPEYFFTYPWAAVDHLINIAVSYVSPKDVIAFIVALGTQ